MSLKCVEHLAQIFRAFSPIKTGLVEQFLPGLSSVATAVISGDIKATLKVRIAMVDLWQVVLRNTFDGFDKRLLNLSKAGNTIKRK